MKRTSTARPSGGAVELGMMANGWARKDMMVPDEPHIHGDGGVAFGGGRRPQQQQSSLGSRSLSSISAVSAAAESAAASASAPAAVAGVAAASAPVARRYPLRGLWSGAVYLSRETSSPWWINGPTPHSRLEGLKLPSLIKSNQSRI